MNDLGKLDLYLDAFNSIKQLSDALAKVKNEPLLTGYERIFIQNLNGITFKLETKIKQLKDE